LQEQFDPVKGPFRSLAGAAATLAMCVLAAHAWFSVTAGYDVNLVSGVWLALARDLRDGLFYRDLIGPEGYGGTRYFPLFFALIAALMRVGLAPVAAGHAASLIGAAVLLTGASALLVQLGVRRSAAVPVAILATLAPYYVQQTMYSIRVEPLAAGLALWGLSAVAASQRVPQGSWRQLALASAWFTLAIAAKPTAAYAPAAAVLSLLVTRRQSAAWRLAVLTAAGILVVLSGVEWLSGGRFSEAMRATALAGETPGGMLSPALVSRPLSLIATSRLLTVLVALAVAALASAPSMWRQLPAAVLVMAAAATAAALATPGTILTNQIVDLHVAAVLFLGWFAHARPRVANAGALALTLLLVWTAAQNVKRIVTIRSQDSASTLPAQRRELTAAFDACAGPVLAESPLVPILTGRPPMVLDPFAFRVAALRHPAADHLVARLNAREFACVALEQDPGEPRGEGWYRNVHFGWTVVDAVLRNYAYTGTVAGRRVYERKKEEGRRRKEEGENEKLGPGSGFKTRVAGLTRLR
jgi:hypothetical protein